VPARQPDGTPLPRERTPIGPPPREIVTHGPSVPISLDTVLRLAQDQNGQIAIAREKVQEALAEVDLAEKRWLPDVFVGAAYYRHEGGIADFQGNLVTSHYGSMFGGMELCSKLDLREVAFAKVDADRKMWQQQGELSRLTSENLLDAANTYIDLLAAHKSEKISRELEEKLTELLGYAQKRLNAKQTTKDEVERVNAEIFGQRQLTFKLREAGNSARARLNYLLGLDQTAELAITDRLVAFELVDLSVPPDELVGMALRNGPGIREMEALLSVIDEARAKASGPARFLPILEVRVAEGVFGTGPGDGMRWDNRMEAMFGAKWNVTDLLTARPRGAAVQARAQQAQFTYQDLRAKLSMGVHEAHDAITTGRAQIQQGQLQKRSADAAYTFSNDLLRKKLDGSVLNVLLALKTSSAADFDLIRAIRGYDQAQLRLLILTGLADSRHHH